MKRAHVEATYRVTAFHLVALLVFIAYALAEMPTRAGLGGISANAILTTGLAVGLLFALVAVPGMRRARLPASLWFVTALFFVSLLLSGDVYRGTQQFAVWLVFVLTLQLATSVALHRRRRYLEEPLVWASVAWVGVMLLQVFFGSASEIAGTAANRPTAAMLAVLSAFVVARAFKTGRLADVFLAIGLAVAVASSGSRTATAAILLSFLAVAVSRFGVPSFRSLLRLAMVLMVLTGAGWMVMSATAAGERLVTLASSWRQIVDDPYGATAVIATQGRSRAWIGLAERALDRPWTGFGLGAAQAETYMITRNQRFYHPHNDFIRVLFETGVVGLLLFVAVIVQLMVRALRGRVASSSGKHASHAAVGALFAAVALMMTDNVLVYSFVMVPLAVIVGLGLEPSPGGMQSGSLAWYAKRELGSGGQQRHRLDDRTLSERRW